MTYLELTNEQKTILRELKNLLDFGYGQVSKKEYPRKMRPRKTILFSMMAAIHSYSEGIYYLLLEARTHSAEVLLRPVVEAFINLAYVYVGRNERNAVTFLLDDIYDKENMAGKFKQFITKHPKYKTNWEGMENEGDLDNFILDRKKEIENITKHYTYRIGQLPDLRQRAEVYDKSREPKYKRELRDRLEWRYLTMYWYFSNLTHLGAKGLDSFFSKDPNGQVVVSAIGKPEDIKRIALTTYDFYYRFLSFFCKQFNVTDSGELTEFRNKFGGLVKN